MSFQPTAEGVKPLTVGELTRVIKGLLEEALPMVWVVGEISNCRRQGSSGHIYLTLKDAEAQVPAVLWRSLAQRLRFEPRDGLAVVVRGRIEIYPPHGKYQMVIDEMQPRGIGRLELAFQQLKEKLQRLGYFEPRRKKPLPRYPRRVAVITSPTGAAVRDMLEILGRRWPAVEVWVCPVRVQGDGAAAEIAAMIRRINRWAAPGGPEVLIVARGGGSLEDLWAFNEECLAQSIFESRLPVISGVGHETDLTIADLVADVRALTPSEAAERVVPDRIKMLAEIDGQRSRLESYLSRRLERLRQRLDDVSQRRCFRLPLDGIRDREHRLDEAADRLHGALRRQLSQVRERLESQAARLEGLSPLNVLARGYSLTRKEADLTVIRSADQVQPGDRLVTSLQQGKLVSIVEQAVQE
jgi:exodeoxyribonuclease VII large subunit